VVNRGFATELICSLESVFNHSCQKNEFSISENENFYFAFDRYDSLGDLRL